jgi:urease accessory protein
MHIDHLTLMQWLSPGYPVGAFAYSHGLEQAVATGNVSDAASFQDWLTDILRFGSGRSDAILLHTAYRAETSDRIAELDALAEALAPSSERRMETTLQGAAFARTTAAIWGSDAAPRAFPVAIGAAARAQGLDAQLTAAAYLHGFAANLTSAAIRLIPLGQTEGQAALAALTPLCQDIACETATQSPDDIGSSCFAADIASMQHETLYSRQFRS